MFWNELVLSVFDDDGVWENEFEVDDADHDEGGKGHCQVEGELLLIPFVGKSVHHGETPVADPEQTPSKEEHGEVGGARGSQGSGHDRPRFGDVEHTVIDGAGHLVLGQFSALKGCAGIINAHGAVSHLSKQN